MVGSNFFKDIKKYGSMIDLYVNQIYWKTKWGLIYVCES